MTDAERAIAAGVEGLAAQLRPAQDALVAAAPAACAAFMALPEARQIQHALRAFGMRA